VRVISATLWTHIPFHAASRAGSINDYNQIYKKPIESDALELISFVDTRQWHDCELNFIAEQIELSINNKEKNCVVLTHHAPSFLDTSDPMFNGPFRNRMNFAFATSLEYLFRNFGIQNNTNVHTWAFGHTHVKSCHKNMFGTYVVANQLGYPHESNGFIKDGFIIDVSKS